MLEMKKDNWIWNLPIDGLGLSNIVVNILQFNNTTPLLSISAVIINILHKKNVSIT